MTVQTLVVGHCVTHAYILGVADCLRAGQSVLNSLLLINRHVGCGAGGFRGIRKEGIVSGGSFNPVRLDGLIRINTVVSQTVIYHLSGIWKARFHWIPRFPAQRKSRAYSRLCLCVQIVTAADKIMLNSAHRRSKLLICADSPASGRAEERLSFVMKIPSWMAVDHDRVPILYLMAIFPRSGVPYILQGHAIVIFREQSVNFLRIRCEVLL